MMLDATAAGLGTKTSAQNALAQDFVQFCVDCGALRFGEFKTKAGRMSPYFFNAGLFDDGTKLIRLAQFYAQALIRSGLEFDMIFGPAYKGIALGAAVAMELARMGKSVPFSYNRKEAKDHGEGGTLVGAPLKGRVLIVDDVMSAGTAVRQSIALIKAAGATPHAVVIALDRQEKATALTSEGHVQDLDHSAVQYVQQQLGMQVCSVAKLADLLQYLDKHPPLTAHRSRVMAYRQRYGVDQEHPGPERKKPAPNLTAAGFFRSSALASALITLLCTTGVAAQTGSSGIYTCVDNSSRRVTSDRPIPECLDREQRQLGNSGALKRVVPPSYTARERAEIDARRKQEEERRTRAIEEKRRDRALLARYPNQVLHHKDRDRALAQVDAVTQVVIKRERELVQERKQIDLALAAFKQDPSKIPMTLRRQIDDNEEQMQTQKRLLNDQNAEKARVNAKFDAELEKLRVLWGGGSK